ncbi:MAG: hypothetical protein JRD93_17570 [Deltaproteobacteria bacterium]|nr:hypothetical protein [Deltaproteobacteria bacterium]
MEATRLRVTVQRIAKNDFRFFMEAVKPNGDKTLLSAKWNGDVAHLKVGDEIVMEIGPDG